MRPYLLARLRVLAVTEPRKHPAGKQPARAARVQEGTVKSGPPAAPQCPQRAGDQACCGELPLHTLAPLFLLRPLPRPGSPSVSRDNVPRYLTGDLQVSSQRTAAGTPTWKDPPKRKKGDSYFCWHHPRNACELPKSSRNCGLSFENANSSQRFGSRDCPVAASHQDKVPLCRGLSGCHRLSSRPPWCPPCPRYQGPGERTGHTLSCLLGTEAWSNFAP